MLLSMLFNAFKRYHSDTCRKRILSAAMHGNGTKSSSTEFQGSCNLKYRKFIGPIKEEEIEY
jgi:hypothetical protein